MYPDRFTKSLNTHYPGRKVNEEIGILTKSCYKMTVGSMV